jgi:hypothetical protein
VHAIVEEGLNDSESGLPEERDRKAHAYNPDLFLDAIGPPYLSSGGGPFGTFVRGGGSLLFSDLLGERKVAVSGQAGNRLRDLALRVAFINRQRRWNWGAVAEAQPSLRRLPRTLSNDVDGEPAITRETHYFERTQFRLAGLLAYPLNRAQRLEFEAGARHTIFRETVSATGRSMEDGRLLTRTTTAGSGGATVGEASAAYVQPAEAFLFADSGLVWARSSELTAGSPGRRLVSSYGAGVRVNAFGFPLELAVVRAVDPPSHGWSFDLSFRSGF